MIKLHIDGQEAEAEEGQTILDAAKGLGIEIPTLCHHRAIPPVGACRVCVVEIRDGGRPGLVPACAYPAQEGLVVETASEAVRESRSMTIQLLLARCPEAEVLRKLAEQWDAPPLTLDAPLDHVEPPKGVPEGAGDRDKCILCGLCVRVCQDIIGPAATAFAGRGIERKVTTPYKLLSDVCIGCGACALVCPTGAIDPAEFCSHSIEKIPNEFNLGFDTRTPIHLPFPQAVPNKPILDRENCIHFRTGGCGACETICPAGAIDLEMEDEIVEEEVGAIIVATGYELLDPSVYEEYGYGRYPDVVTSLEFERLVSASGPTNGELTRPSNGEPPKSIVFLQCIGSREETGPGKPYCSKICCMYTAKHAILYKHKVHDGQAFVFFMDVRAGGKNYEEFVRRVSKEKVATYLRGRVSKIFPHDGKLVVQGADTLSGGQVEIAADMVVLAAAVVPSKGATELAQKLRISYDQHGFLSEAHPKLRPVETNTAGIFLAGACHSAKDIPDSVAQASAAASKALGLVVHDRLTREPTIGIVNELTCNGCFECENVCAYGAISPKDIKDRSGATVAVLANINEGLCQGCGACMVTCRSKSIEVQGYTDNQLFSEINAITR
ncbi:MAG: 4Fe-4S dicluster domain-containing protein [Nitrospiraceae bacterium]|nr:4Fe-4S dicluster domain-containing protein [Nitrospiraceae bacterium]